MAAFLPRPALLRASGALKSFFGGSTPSMRGICMVSPALHADFGGTYPGFTRNSSKPDRSAPVVGRGSGAVSFGPMTWVFSASSATERNSRTSSTCVRSLSRCRSRSGRFPRSHVPCLEDAALEASSDSLLPFSAALSSALPSDSLASSSGFASSSSESSCSVSDSTSS